MSNILIGKEKQFGISNQYPLPVDIVSDTAYVQSITGEAVALYYRNGVTLTADAGQAAGTIVVGKLAYTGILDKMGTMIGNSYDTSLAWTTGTVLPAASIQPFNPGAIESANNKTLQDIAKDICSGFSNGQRCLDSRNGIIFGKKATTGTGDTAAYKVMTTTTGGGTTVTESVNVAKIAGTATDTNSGNKSAGSQRVVIATDDVNLAAINTNTAGFGIATVLTGGSTTVAAHGTAVVLGTTLAIKGAFIRAKLTNTGNVFVGDSTVDEVTNQQIILAAGDSVTVPIANRVTIYVDAAVNGEGVDYLCYG